MSREALQALIHAVSDIHEALFDLTDQIAAPQNMAFVTKKLADAGKELKTAYEAMEEGVDVQSVNS